MYSIFGIILVKIYEKDNYYCTRNNNDSTSIENIINNVDRQVYRKRSCDLFK